jgi:hypothetical protein
MLLIGLLSNLLFLLAALLLYLCTYQKVCIISSTVPLLNGDAVCFLGVMYV